MKAKEIQELLDFIASSGLGEVSIETEQIKIHVKRTCEQPVSIIQPSIPPLVQPSVVQGPTLTATSGNVHPTEQPKPAENSASKSDANLVTIKSPMIGTFYRSANPESPPFVNVGDEVTKGQVLCIIEAMKLFNEIESEYSGKIVQILVENASPVEFDQPLFVIEKK
ncbi:MAG: acetyl-CoA carboxylase biotin carboxyl carrier protein [Cytophagaceae bacterium]|nr:acetyl-CoA carboxylase biotin carboxyl carrier protein [Cytophagaceae bacterium]MDW8456780.1 acetyl-CoA carboxylase biotin carboxyl carrier protein [Cytophagaceae bacterium]